MSFRRTLTRFVLGVFVAGVALLFLGSPAYFDYTSHTNPEDSLQLNLTSYNGSPSQQGWTSGEIRNQYSGGLADKLLYKKWDSFVFVTYNYYIVEVILADLGLLSQISISLTKFKDKDQIHVEHFASFTLQDFWEGDFNITDKQFQFSIQRRETSLHRIAEITFDCTHNDKKVVGHLTQEIQKKSCMTFVRPYSSIKCLTGSAKGSTSISHRVVDREYGYVQETSDNWVFRDDISTTLFDGFRGSGYYWYWVWAMGIGWTENVEDGAKINAPIRRVGISLGFMMGMEENFVTIDGEPIKLHGVEYRLEDGLKKKTLEFKSQNPKGAFTFQVKSKHLLEDNKVVAHKHLQKVYGVWEGQIQFPNGTLFEFSKAFGLVEISKSRF